MRFFSCMVLHVLNQMDNPKKASPTNITMEGIFSSVYCHVSPYMFIPGNLGPTNTIKHNQNKSYIRYICIKRLGLVSLFNGISTFVGYLMPKLFSSKNSGGTI